MQFVKSMVVAKYDGHLPLLSPWQEPQNCVILCDVYSGTLLVVCSHGLLEFDPFHVIVVMHQK